MDQQLLWAILAAVPVVIALIHWHTNAKRSEYGRNHYMERKGSRRLDAEMSEADDVFCLCLS